MDLVKLVKEYDEYRITAHFSLGNRDYYEDEYVIHRNKKNLTFFGIFDGHGGKEAAQHAKDNLFKKILSNLHIDIRDDVYDDDDYSFMEAIKKGFQDTQESMWDVIHKWDRGSRDLPSTSGTTASIAILRCDRINGKNLYKIYIGHVGDTKIIMVKEDHGTQCWTGLELTTDHSPRDPTERQRILEMGGDVHQNGRVIWRRPKINHGSTRKNCELPLEATEPIPFLSVSRALGDLWSYCPKTDDYFVSPIPDVSVMELDFAVHKCLILGTDGLWNVVNVQEATDTCKISSNLNYLRKLKPELKMRDVEIVPAYRLVIEALKNIKLKKIRADNITAVTIEFKFAEMEENLANSDTQLVPQVSTAPQTTFIKPYPRPLKKPTRISPGPEPLKTEILDEDEIKEVETRRKSPSLLRPAILILPSSIERTRQMNNQVMVNGTSGMNESFERKRGRPRGIKKFHVGNDESQVDPLRESPPRGRGRPKKAFSESDVHSLLESDTSEHELQIDESAKNADVPKKKRGRPSKHNVTINDVQHDSETDTSEVTFQMDNHSKLKVKKRGRPPKSIEIANDSDSNQSDSLLKKKRGRPSKSKEPDSEFSHDPVNIKKKRGRPSKSKEFSGETTDFETSILESEGETSMKKRGRPKKNKEINEREVKNENSEDSEKFSSEDEYGVPTKKRGRPKKDKTNNSANNDVSESESNISLTKKKRGRPSNKSILAAGGSIRTSEGKKKRGRPSKANLESEGIDVYAFSEEEIEIPKKKRGRPSNKIKRGPGRPPKCKDQNEIGTEEKYNENFGTQSHEVNHKYSVEPIYKISLNIIPKKRGRPMKMKDNGKEKENEEQEEETETEEINPLDISISGKRQRKPPLKFKEFSDWGISSDNDSPLHKDQENGLKKKRGRPAKTKSTEVTENEEPSASTSTCVNLDETLEIVKKKRGRPSKVAKMNDSMADEPLDEDTNEIENNVEIISVPEEFPIPLETPEPKEKWTGAEIQI